MRTSRVSRENCPGFTQNLARQGLVCALPLPGPDLAPNRAGFDIRRTSFAAALVNDLELRTGYLSFFVDGAKHLRNLLLGRNFGDKRGAHVEEGSKLKSPLKQQYRLFSH